ncbi:Tfp pilus assembly protein FimT/FimU [Spiribacter insolitus]|uniref:Type II secretion system protein n=1 Tax=Spiribacter insolitus TaxID=3122417 RepID=A0ABV3T5Z4_9GAMM
MKIRNLRNTNARQLIAERKERGFTLIELVIVLAVLGVLAALAIPQLTGLQAEAELQSTAINISSEATEAFATAFVTDGSSGWDSIANACSTAAGLSSNGSSYTVSETDDNDDPSVEITVPYDNSGVISTATCYVYNDTST